MTAEKELIEPYSGPERYSRRDALGHLGTDQVDVDDR
jgi:hypothetical protein